MDSTGHDGVGRTGNGGKEPEGAGADADTAGAGSSPAPGADAAAAASAAIVMPEGEGAGATAGPLRGSLPAEIASINERAAGYAESLRRMHSEISKVIVGQNEIIERLMVALVAQGHVLLEGVPGLAKTLLVKTLAECVKTYSVK